VTPLVVTFDLFSALVDSRSGAGRVLSRLGSERAWGVEGAAVYDRWDALTKQAHRDCRVWVPHAALARDALAATYRELALPGDPDSDIEALYSTLPDWPLWPDVAEWLPRIGERWPVGVLSNVDDALFDRTQVASLVDRRLLFSSERLQTYKPDARLYLRAQERAGRLVHVATSARDVRGALEAGLAVVRLRRPGHRLDPAGPLPPVEAGGLEELHELLPQVAAPPPSPGSPSSASPSSASPSA
jgi:2-haloacid dehalogenase